MRWSNAQVLVLSTQSATRCHFVAGPDQFGQISSLARETRATAPLTDNYLFVIGSFACDRRLMIPSAIPFATASCRLAAANLLRMLSK